MSLPKSILSLLTPLLLLLPGSTVSATAEREAVFVETIRPLLADHCFDCHDDDTQKGGVNLAQHRDLVSLQRHPKLWENVVRQIEEKAMPPRNKKPLPVDTFHLLVDWLQWTLENPDPGLLPPDPGEKVLHRLGRDEYNLTLRDLLGISIRPADRFPPDGGGGGGFDNNADTLFVPPVLMERYLQSADEALAAAPKERLFPSGPVWYTPERWTARDNLRAFATRAFRRPVTSDELSSLLGLFRRIRADGADFERALKTVYKAVLVSPHFLFRVEQDRPGTGPVPVSGHELATRLSYFLWSSMPDDRLMEAARRGDLGTDAGLEREVVRMLADPRAEAFFGSFTGQWLGTRELASKSSPDTRRFPAYTADLREAMMSEPVAFFRGLVRSNRPVLDLIDADYAYVNADLARLYDLPPVDGPELRRVGLSDRRRGGVTGMAAVLTQTSYPRRTSPVLRGKWILEEVLGTPPPPPPPIVATLPPDDRVRDGLTLRQRLEEHRKNPNCAACHARLDPMGFALENFDPIGRWRGVIDGKPVDASGVLPGGDVVDGPAALKDALLARRELFVRHLVEKLLAYSLGRGLEYYDIPAVRQIVRRLEAEDFRARTLVLEVVRSLPFRHRRGGDWPESGPPLGEVAAAQTPGI